MGRVEARTAAAASPNCAASVGAIRSRIAPRNQRSSAGTACTGRSVVGTCSGSGSRSGSGFGSGSGSGFGSGFGFGFRFEFVFVFVFGFGLWFRGSGSGSA